MSDAYSGMSIAVLNSALRGLHVYKYVPKKGTTVDISFSEVAEVKKKYPRAIQVTGGPIHPTATGSFWHFLSRRFKICFCFEDVIVYSKLQSNYKL